MKQGILPALAPWLALIGTVFWAIYCVNYILGSPLFLAANGESDLLQQVLFSFYGFLTLLVGVFLGAVYNQIKSERTKGVTEINISAVIGMAVKTPDFWLGIFASPVIYVILLQAVDFEDISPAKVFALSLVGLQNGFVCNTIADSMIGQKKQAKDE